METIQSTIIYFNSPEYSLQYMGLTKTYLCQSAAPIFNTSYILGIIQAPVYLNSLYKMQLVIKGPSQKDTLPYKTYIFPLSHLIRDCLRSNKKDIPWQSILQNPFWVSKKKRLVIAIITNYVQNCLLFRLWRCFQIPQMCPYLYDLLGFFSCFLHRILPFGHFLP